jgi:predicted phosphoribosyltransferase
MPGHPEYAIGAIASGGVRVLSEEAIRWHGIPASAIEAIADLGQIWNSSAQTGLSNLSHAMSGPRAR